MKRIIFYLSLVLLVLAFSAWGQQEDSEAIILYVDQVYTIAVDIPERIAIGNPDIIDVAAVDTKKITINAKAPGVTNLVWWDAVGEQALKFRVYAEDMSNTKLRIDDLLASLELSDVYTQVADSEAKVLLLGEVKSDDDLGRINTLLKQLETKIINLIQVKEEEASIEIEVQVLELSKDAAKTMGFSWPSSISLTESSSPVSTAVTGWSALFHVSDWTRTAFASRLDLLMEEGKARMLSRPRLACQSGKEAELLIGGEKPIMTTAVSEGGETSEVGYKEYGIKLNMRPVLVDEDRVFLSLNIEVSDVGTEEVLGSASAPSARAYPVLKRSTSTSIYLNDGQTMAISGLIRQKTEEDLRKFPWLADVPILGLFFRQRVSTFGGGAGERGDIELVITLTPKIIGKGEAISTDKLEVVPSAADAVKPEQTASSSLASIDEYKKTLSRYILSNLSYPYEARAAGLSGEIILSLHISSTGNLLQVKLKQSSGSSILDNSSIRMFRRISPFPTFPSNIVEQDLWLDIPLVYREK